MARYVAISESEMSDFMAAIGFTELSVEQRGSFGRKPVKERVYEAPVGVGRIRVYSSVVGPATRDRGKDAIRVQYWVGDQKVYGSKRVHRTQNWRKNLLQRTEEIRESVESGPLSRIPKDSRGDLMTARRSRLPHERFWGSVNYPEIRESRRFEAASVLPKELKTDKITDRVMAWQYLIDDSEKQHQLLKLQTALKMGLITQDEILESLDRAMSKNAESNVSRKAEKEELILEHLNKNRQTSKYDGKFENTEGGVVELLGITRAGVSKTLRDMEAKGLIYARNLHVPGGRRKVQCWYVVGSGTDRGFGAETIYVRQMGDADQERIENELRSALRTEFQEMSPEEIESLVELGLDSKLSDLDNVIDIETFEAEKGSSRRMSGLVERQMVDSFPFNGNLIHWKGYANEMPNNWSNFPQAIIEGVDNMNPQDDDEVYFISSNVYSEEHNNGIFYGAEIVWYDTKGRSQKQFFEDFMKANRSKKHGDMFNDSNILKYGFGLEKGWAAESFTPPASAVSAAKKGLAQRKKWGRGGLSPAEAKSQGIDSGVTRARKIASGKVSKHDVRRMSAFNRHRKNNNPSKKMPDGGPTAGTIAWNLWGGSAGVNWAKKKSAAMNAESFETKEEIYVFRDNLNTGYVGKPSQFKTKYGSSDVKELKQIIKQKDDLERVPSLINFELKPKTIKRVISRKTPMPVDFNWTHQWNAEGKLSKTSCCCGATESNPCACMKAATPMSCSAIEPKCACYKDLEKNAESEDYGVEPRWM